MGPTGEQVGVVPIEVALRLAREADLDLVEVAPNSKPPVVKIMDYGKFKYDQSKQQKAKTANKAAEMKQVRLGRSVKIDPHDVGIRIAQSRRFLMAGHKVMVTQRFRGREIAHREIGLEHLKRVADELADVAKVEQAPRWMGKEASIILAPDKVKIEAIKRKLEKEKAERAAAGLPEIVEPELPDIEDEIDDHDDEHDEAAEAPEAEARQRG